MSYQTTILADSISPDGVRLTTVMSRFPRFILAEVNTHRMFSRNSASSRAIPTEQLIAKVREDPFVPATFNKRVKGMGVGEELSATASEEARATWLRAAMNAADEAETLMDIGLDKSRANRLLEPFLWHTAVISATEFDHFFALRQPNEGLVPNLDFPAQPEIQIMARGIRDAMTASKPTPLKFGQWHLPTATNEELVMLCDLREGCRLRTPDGKHSPNGWLEDLKLACAGRLARWTSYDNQTDEPFERSVERANGLKSNYHMSPFEHIARPCADGDHPWPWGEGDPPFIGNFRGWFQMRKEIPSENAAHLVVA